MPLTKSEEKRKKAAQLKKKKKRKKTKKAENEDKPEQQGQTSVDDGIVGDNQGTHLFMFVDLTSTIPHVHFEDIIFSLQLYMNSVHLHVNILYQNFLLEKELVQYI